MDLSIMQCSTRVIGDRNPSYRASDVNVQLPDHDTDVVLFFPNGEKMIVQWRVEGPSLDICLDTDHTVINWKGESMEPAPRDPGFKTKAKPGTPASEHVRKAAQLCIPLPDDYAQEKEKPCSI